MTDTWQHSLVHEMVQSVAAADPGRIAVVAGETVVTYGELNTRADQLAAQLTGLGGPATSVALLLPRSADFVLAALAVLKAGGSYVPLDADYPPERLRTMLDAAHCPTVITLTRLLDRLPEEHGCELLCLDVTAAPVAASAAEVAVQVESLAYTMFTSGSTGRPKGVMITHGGLAHLVRQSGPLSVRDDDIVLHVSSVSFDATTYDVWNALGNGARLIIAPPGRLSTAEIAALMHRHRVTTALLPTGLFHLMVDEHLPELARLRKVVVGGDVLSPRHAGRFVRAVRTCALVNAYGPTEVTVAVCAHEVAPDQDDRQPVPIGRALQRMRVRVLDDDLRLVPPGTAGQLHAGGTGLARGYLDDPAQTARRFVPDPWTPGARLYATGDMVRERPDGTLEFLGRDDDQFKKRGFRIELSEVRAALLGDPGVRDALVLPDGATADTRRLVAVLVPKAGTKAENLIDEVRSRLRAELPDYMIPDVWATVEAVPLTPNGKVDRTALLQLATTPAGPDPELSAAPATADETELADIWRELLSVDHIGRDDDFFDLGGHSLLANRIVTQVRRRMGVSLPLASVFDHPTVAELAQRIRALAGPEKAGS
jgi:amino acid adenylation domain-containing protein